MALTPVLFLSYSHNNLANNAAPFALCSISIAINMLSRELVQLAFDHRTAISLKSGCLFRYDLVGNQNFTV